LVLHLRRKNATNTVTPCSCQSLKAAPSHPPKQHFRVLMCIPACGYTTGRSSKKQTRREFVKAVVYTAYGLPEILQIKEVAQPTPTDDEVLIKVAAASVNRSDWENLIGKPLYARMRGLLKPRHQILGSDIAGRVEMAGRNIRQFQPGDEVFGHISSYTGGFAEYVWVLENDRAL